MTSHYSLDFAPATWIIDAWTLPLGLHVGRFRSGEWRPAPCGLF